MGMCGCGVCKHVGLRIMRAIILLAIVIIVFMLGVKIGELKGALEGRYGDYRMMGAQSYGGYVPNGAYPMMRGYLNPAVDEQVPATSSKQ